MTLKEANARWATCASCALSATRKCIVLGEPYLDPPFQGEPLVLVLGEAPGPTEDREGRPFVGPAGQLLRDGYLKPAGVRFAYITNRLACSPGRIRPPTPTELAACAPRLADQLAALQPKGAILVGRVAEEAADQLGGTPCCPVVHPSALLRAGYPNPATEKKLRTQVAKILRLMARLRGEKTPKRPANGNPATTPGHEHAWAVTGRWRPLEPDLPELPLEQCACGKAKEPAWPRKRTASKSD